MDRNASLESTYTVKRVRNVRIPMPDGISLAADVFMPEADGRFPVVFDYYPYRKNDQTASAYVGHRYLAADGSVLEGIGLVDLETLSERRLTDLGHGFAVRDFDVSPDGREIVFDHTQENSHVVLIDLPPR